MPCGALLELGWINLLKTVKRSEDVDESDHAELDLRLLPVLEAKRLGEILREELEKRGWKKEEDGTLTKQIEQGTASLEVGSSTLKLVVGGKKSISAEASATGVVKETDADGQKAIEEKAGEKADLKLSLERRAAKDELMRENLEKLEKALGPLKREADEVTASTTKRALLERAQQLGAIESVTEKRSGSNVEVIIQVVKS
ncbi:MAG: hypothetical protein QM817_35570 [Archangium sp.]